MTKCAICGQIADYKITPYTDDIPEAVIYYCADHALDEPIKDTAKTYKIEALAHTANRAIIEKSAIGSYVK